MTPEEHLLAAAEDMAQYGKVEGSFFRDPLDMRSPSCAMGSMARSAYMKYGDSRFLNSEALAGEFVWGGKARLLLVNDPIIVSDGFDGGAGEVHIVLDEAEVSKSGAAEMLAEHLRRNGSFWGSLLKYLREHTAFAHPLDSGRQSVLFSKKDAFTVISTVNDDPAVSKEDMVLFMKEAASHD
jgi:hypothetical protein